MCLRLRAGSLTHERVLKVGVDFQKFPGFGHDKGPAFLKKFAKTETINALEFKRVLILIKNMHQFVYK